MFAFVCEEDLAKFLGLSSNTGELEVFIVEVLRLVNGLILNFGKEGLRRFNTGLLVCL